MDPVVIRVQLREQHLYYHDKLLPVSRVIPHPDYYDAQGGADIALLELKDPVNISGRVQVVTLPPASETFPPKTPCWVTGWGDVSTEGAGTGCTHYPDSGVPWGCGVPTGQRSLSV